LKIDNRELAQVGMVAWQHGTASTGHLGTPKISSFFKVLEIAKNIYILGT
jgi:hypothetical protein